MLKLRVIDKFCHWWLDVEGIKKHVSIQNEAFHYEVLDNRARMHDQNISDLKKQHHRDIINLKYHLNKKLKLVEKEFEGYKLGNAMSKISDENLAHKDVYVWQDIKKDKHPGTANNLLKFVEKKRKYKKRKPKGQTDWTRD